MRGSTLSVAIFAAIVGFAAPLIGAATPGAPRAGDGSGPRHGAGPRVLGLSKGAATSRSRSSQLRGGSNARRRFFARAAERERVDLFPAGRQADPFAAGVSRSQRSSARPSRGGRSSWPTARPTRLPAGRSPAGVAALRRALGPALARRRRLRRHRRLRQRRQQPHLERRQMEVSRLRHRGLQRRQALRPVSHGAARRRRAGRLAARAALHAGDPRRPHRHRLPPHGPRSNARAGEQYPAQLLRRAPRHGRDAGKQPVRSHRQLRPLPFAQVRPDPAARLLPPDGPVDAGLQSAELEAGLSLEARDQGPGDSRRLPRREGGDRAAQFGRRPRRGGHAKPHVAAPVHARAQGNAQKADCRAHGRAAAFRPDSGPLRRRPGPGDAPAHPRTIRNARPGSAAGFPERSVRLGACRRRRPARFKRPRQRTAGRVGSLGDSKKILARPASLRG